jgi:hypothetical protein
VYVRGRERVDDDVQHVAEEAHRGGVRRKDVR